MRYCPECETRVSGEGERCAECGDELVILDADSLLGVELDGKYRVCAILGSGGMGTVYRARQRRLQRDVAIKVLRPDKRNLETATARFRREVRVVSRLSHPHIVTVHDFGQTEEGLLYLVMEYVEGVKLAEQIHWLDPMPLERVVHIVAQICDALEEAHAQEVVHRDLNPANVLLLRRAGAVDYVKVLDFGLAKILDSSSEPAVTRQGDVVGTAGYMSPEQIQGLPIDVRVDLYSLGVMVFELLSGRLPYRGENPAATMFKHLNEPIPLIRERNPLLVDVPKEIDSFMPRALAKEPSQRFASVAEFRRALIGLLDFGRVPAECTVTDVRLGDEETLPAIEMRQLKPTEFPETQELPLEELTAGQEPTVKIVLATLGESTAADAPSPAASADQHADDHTQPRPEPTQRIRPTDGEATRRAFAPESEPTLDLDE